MEAATNMGSTIHDDIVNCSVGQSWIVPGKILDVEVPCLVDMGSRVTIITLSLLQQILKKPPREHLVDTTSWLKLKAANGLELPYLGYVERPINVFGQELTGRGMLVRQDDPARVIKPQCLLGMNVLGLLDRFKKVISDSEGNEKDGISCVKVLAGKSVLIPAKSVCPVKVTGPVHQGLSMVERLKVPLMGGLTVANTLVDSSNGVYFVEVTN